MNNRVTTLRSEYKLAVVGIVALCAAIVVLWQAKIVMDDLDRLDSESQSHFDAVLKNYRDHRDALKD